MSNGTPSNSGLPFAERLLLAKGGALISPETALATLVRLAADEDNKIREAAMATLQQLPDERCKEWLSSPETSRIVLRYFLEPERMRVAILPLLLEHPESPEDAVTALATLADPTIVPVLLENLDLLKTSSLIALKDNPTYLLWQKNPPEGGFVVEVDILEMLILEMETDKGITPERCAEMLAEIDTDSDIPEEEKKRATGVVQKIAQMKVAQRVKLALLGSREERSLLIRDSSRVVLRAVLVSPKLTDSEAEGFASLKNVSQEVLRMIAMSRKFIKRYIVVKNLVMNPRSPLDITLPLLNRLLIQDARVAAASKDIPDTLRKMAQRLVQTRAT
ncbi:MAG: hypothetical protein EXQ56_13165 [Acidobacteria bacterium]|nr:hypothetical protein [Acidobacteriota bacterium]